MTASYEIEHTCPARLAGAPDGLPCVRATGHRDGHVFHSESGDEPTE
ncbi:MAG TPA: hypothetical protein VFV01_47900 [Spirillospora sp.]|nr:hypothetical protein [Spirillospora sp.]